MHGVLLDMNRRRVLADENWRQMARRIRDWHWKILEKIAEHNPLWICWWDKARRHSERGTDGQWVDTHPPDVFVFGLIHALGFGEWMIMHPDWFDVGEWSDDRYAAPVRITDAGRAALANREKYDMEVVRGGLVEPGWEATPAPKGAEE